MLKANILPMVLTPVMRTVQNMDWELQQPVQTSQALTTLRIGGSWMRTSTHHVYAKTLLMRRIAT